MKKLWVSIVLLGTAAADTSPSRSNQFTDEFSRLGSPWVEVSGQWSVEGGALVGRAAAGENARVRLNRRMPGATELDVDVQCVEAEGFAGMHITFKGRHFYLYPDNCAARESSGIYPPYVGSPTRLKAEGVMKVKLVRTRAGYRFTVDGTLIVETDGGPAAEIDALDISLWATAGASIKYDNLRVK